jgi:predicted RNase H-like nuclease
MKYLGVDACSSGWFAGIVTDGALTTERHDEFAGLWESHGDAARIVVDIPIGLPESGRRACDEQATATLGSRGSSVFYTPCRAVLDAEGYDEANELNRERTGYGLSRQTWNILPKVRAVEEFLTAVDPPDGVVLEGHPELAFYAFDDGTPMAHSKRSAEGRERRLELLEAVLDGAAETYEAALETHYRKDVARDDVLDALVLAATARSETLVSLPPARDHRTQRQVIVYPDPEDGRE